MLNLALVALLSGSLFATPDGDCKKERTCERDQAPVALEAANDARSITGDTYAFGRPADSAPIKLFVEFGRGSVEQRFNANGTEVPLSNGVEKVVSQRLAVGVHLNVINFTSFKFGVGGQLNVAQDKFEIGGNTIAETSFGLQGAKLYGMLRGRVVGVHGGYFLDLADVPDASATLSSSDQRDALFFGGDFDYPSEHFRLFAGVDYFMPRDGDVVTCIPSSPTDLCGGGTSTTMVTDQDNTLMFTMGGGVRFSVFELGAAFLVRSHEKVGDFNASGGHAGTVAPYLRISPPSLPISAFIQGAVAREYNDYGYNIGGGNDIVSGFGFTAGLTIGFE